jgi:flagellar L-ring protein precursor FlgH
MNHFKKLFLASICLMLGAVISPEKLSGQTPSIFERRDHQRFNLIADVKARRPGDLLFVTIVEQSDVNNIDQRRLQKQNAANSVGDGGFSVGGDLGAAAGSLGFTQDSSANRQITGNTQYQSQRGFVDRFTVRVIDTLPNGNLVIGGRRDVALEGDTRRLVLTGIVRAVDVSPNNVVSSGQISDLSIRYESTGHGNTEQSFVNQGWLSRKVNKWWPY